MQHRFQFLVLGMLFCLFNGCTNDFSEKQKLLLGEWCAVTMQSDSIHLHSYPNFGFRFAANGMLESLDGFYTPLLQTKYERTFFQYLGTSSYYRFLGETLQLYHPTKK